MQDQIGKAQWQHTGVRPAVAVWTADQLATFLGDVTDSLFAFWWLTALRGLRRGEMCGLRWTDIDLLDKRTVRVLRDHRQR
ncbi:integrase [Micromonospora jinlongensis]|uniref:Integrase n=1 Tax=Micromonospora jinlongensis TaxID=1287877 RepID=A0A7Z0BE39_9ACTN|nr:integrase [Micromonospora jinlongensis]